MAAPLDTDRRSRLETELMALDGVLHASVDPRSGRELGVVRDPGSEQGPIELAVRNRIVSLGYDPTDLDVRVVLPSSPGPRRRVRFEGIEREDHTGQVAITVALEWGGTVYTGSASGERGLALELKTAARAAIHALESLSGQSLELRIIGVKPIHAFDSDLMVASLYRSAGVEQRLVGAVVVSGDPLEAAAVAVLSAMNRTMGNFLHAAD
ncbi:MAG: hypothetical protein ACOCUW_00320 [Gemmatimonadota bacterium]